MFDRPEAGERAILVHLNIHQSGDDAESPEEFTELAISAGVEPVGFISGSRVSPHPGYFVGTGKAEEIRDAVSRENAEVVLFDHALSPVQERNLEKLFKCRVLDRTGLILDIFAQRARSHEGKLQVELAQLRHLSTRLIRGWTHLERQKGGIGLRGPGETQLETDRRLLGERIKLLKRKLEKVQRQRQQGRRSRIRAEIPTVSLVGYTNAGKSTLFNRLTSANVYAADQLFATLDPTLRRLEMPAGQPVILADTVGFIRHLPHDLVAAFRSTLTETRDADLLLHVVDASSNERDANIHQVNEVLKEIEAEDRPQLMVYNKIDLMEQVEPHIERDELDIPIRVWVSALNGQGLDLLMQAVEERVNADVVEQYLVLPPKAGRLRAKIFQYGKILHEDHSPDGEWLLSVQMPRSDWNMLCHRESIHEYAAKEPQTRLAVASEAP